MKKKPNPAKTKPKNLTQTPDFIISFKIALFFLEFLSHILIAVVFLDTLACCLRVKSGINF